MMSIDGSDFRLWEFASLEGDIDGVVIGEQMKLSKARQCRGVALSFRPSHCHAFCSYHKDPDRRHSTGIAYSPANFRT